MTDQEGMPPDAPIIIDMQGIEEVDAEYVNIIQVNQDPYTFQVAFGRYVPPLQMRPEEQEAFRARVLREGLPTQPVCRLLVAPAVLRDMVDVLQQQLSAYEMQFGPIARPQAESARREDKSDGH